MVTQVVPQTASSAMDKETGTPQVKVAQVAERRSNIYVDTLYITVTR